MADDSSAEVEQATDASREASPVADDVLLNAVDAARAALAEITPAATIGAPAGHIVEGEHVLSLLFENKLGGYPGWFWTVSLSREPDTGEVNVLEAELMPGDDALLAPDWVPWADRLAEYQAQKKAEREAAAAAGEPEPEDEFAIGDDSEDESEDDLDAGDDDLDADEDDESDGEDDSDDVDEDDDDADGEDDDEDDDDLEVADLHDFDDDDSDDVDDFEASDLQGAEEAALTSEDDEEE